ncbi:MAG TPA: PAS domain-containing sensor histidine kinase [Parvibaculum sp.]|uniref:sensor histidine kinase NtrY-like n=1 Tax=Parvibaculum sp. TaxID=2024848 RepID=UPI002CE6FEE5|nr:PAS domain-containing sensor histidine kinase [Parvibaculum sp.]HMM14108.1 PAS domain-containing sensor histidine kinase [Parvibaculum sp.]
MATSDRMERASWDSHLWGLFSRRGFSGTLAIGLVMAAIFLGSFTYMILTGLTPLAPTRGLVITLLIGNLAVVLVLFALIGWRVVRIIIARVSGVAGAKLHARLIAMFAVVAVMPAIIVAVFAAVTLNRGLDFWFGQRTQIIISNAQTVAEAYLDEHHHVLRGDVLAMATDLDRAAPYLATSPERFQQLVATQAALRSLPAAYLINSEGRILAKVTASVAPDMGLPTAEQFTQAQKGEAVLWTVQAHNQIRALVKLGAIEDTYLYVGRFVDARVLQHLAQTREAADEYRSLEQRRITFQVTFALIYVAVALVTLLAAIWLGLWAANRIVDPISKLVQASERISIGDLGVRVEPGETGDELDVLSNAFNRMTNQLESQRNELVAANHQLDLRRQFTEAVLSGVSAGVIGLDNEGHINHANRAALRFFGKSESELVGHDIFVAIPEMAEVVHEAQNHPDRRAQSQSVIMRDGQERTLSIRVTSEVRDSGLGGFVLTFDDITELVRAQRTSAWADVARRIAHEIKNPLTPIQLSAERLRRKYGKEILTDPEVFNQCTDTIIRQVNDIGRMVDEFSSFARMPTAVIKQVEINEIVRQGVFLQRVAHPDIDYASDMPAEPVLVECDGRLVSQALTNILKNAAEAIRGQHEARAQYEDEEESGAGGMIGRIQVALEETPSTVAIVVTDSGCGLPKTDRTRLTEPYITTRTKGTGLGLAIVNKVMEDHGGTLILEDAPASEGWESGARVKLIFPRMREGTDEAQQTETSKIDEAMNGI